jgi:hypothetical protein
MQKLIFILLISLNVSIQASPTTNSYYSSVTLPDIEIMVTHAGSCIDCPLPTSYHIDLKIKSENIEHSFEIENDRCIANSEKHSDTINKPFEKNFMEDNLDHLHLKDYYVACSKMKAGKDVYPNEMGSAKYINLYYFPSDAKDYKVKVTIKNIDDNEVGQLLLYRRDGSKHIFKMILPYE